MSKILICYLFHIYIYNSMGSFKANARQNSQFCFFFRSENLKGRIQRNKIKPSKFHLFLSNLNGFSKNLSRYFWPLVKNTDLKRRSTELVRASSSQNRTEIISKNLWWKWVMFLFDCVNLNVFSGFLFLLPMLLHHRKYFCFSLFQILVKKTNKTEFCVSTLFLVWC